MTSTPSCAEHTCSVDKLVTTTLHSSTRMQSTTSSRAGASTQRSRSLRTDPQDTGRGRNCRYMELKSWGSGGVLKHRPNRSVRFHGCRTDFAWSSSPRTPLYPQSHCVELRLRSSPSPRGFPLVSLAYDRLTLAGERPEPRPEPATGGRTKMCGKRFEVVL